MTRPQTLISIQALLPSLPSAAATTTLAEVATAQGEGATGGDQPAASGSPFGGMMFPLIAVFAIFWFVMIGPERKQRKKRQEMLEALKKGDRVMTTGGMYASVAAVQDDLVTLQIADGVRARFSRASIQTVLVEEDKAAD